MFAPPSKSCRFSHPPSPRARSMAQGISLSADSDSGGFSPPENLSPAALSWSSLFGDSFSESFRFRTILFVICFRRDTARRVRQFQQREVRWKRSTGTFPKLRNSKRNTGQSGLIRSVLEKLFPHFCFGKTNRTRHAVSLQVCTSPAALSWSSLFGAIVLNSFCSCTMAFAVRAERF